MLFTADRIPDPARELCWFDICLESRVAQMKQTAKIPQEGNGFKSYLFWLSAEKGSRLCGNGSGNTYVSSLRLVAELFVSHLRCNSSGNTILNALCDLSRKKRQSTGRKRGRRPATLVEVVMMFNGALPPFPAAFQAGFENEILSHFSHLL